MNTLRAFAAFAAFLSAGAFGSTAFGQYGYDSGVNDPWHPYAVQRGDRRQDFYGGYNTGPYAGNFGFYRRVPPTYGYGGQSFPRRYSPYHPISVPGRQHQRRFGGVEFYGF